MCNIPDVQGGEKAEALDETASLSEEHPQQRNRK